MKDRTKALIRWGMFIFSFIMIIYLQRTTSLNNFLWMIFYFFIIIGVVSNYNRAKR